MRQYGFYLVKYKGEWTAAEWSKRGWAFKFGGFFGDSDMDEINEKKLESGDLK